MPMIRYLALNGTHKIANLDRMERFWWPSNYFQIAASRHCGGLLAIILTQGGSWEEITEPSLREQLQAMGETLSWERSA